MQKITPFIQHLIISLTVLLLMTPFSAIGQEYQPFFQNVVNTIDFDQLDANLQTHEDFGIKQPGTEALNNSFAWLKSKYESWGYTHIDIDTFYYAGHECYNLIVTKTGSLFPDNYVIVDGHYDSRNGPGANDNGTGTVIVLECARLLKDIDTDYSVRFIHFSAEEVGLVGSRHYVDNVVLPEDHQIKLVFNIDAVGGVDGLVNNIIVCEQDESYPHDNDLASSQYTDTLSVLMEMYSEMETEISYAYATDYVPFMEEGYIITGLYEYHETPYAHSPNDLIANLDLASVHEVAKGSVAASLYFSGAHNTTGFRENESLDFISIYPNPASDRLHIQMADLGIVNHLQIYSQQGQEVMSMDVDLNSQIDISSLPGGLYFLVFNASTPHTITKKLSKI